MVDYQKVLDFVRDNEVKITFRTYGRQGQMQLCISVDKSHTPLPGGDIGKAVIQAILNLMTARGQWP
jgi:hypothetical protein